MINMLFGNLDEFKVFLNSQWSVQAGKVMIVRELHLKLSCPIHLLMKLIILRMKSDWFWMISYCLRKLDEFLVILLFPNSHLTEYQRAILIINWNKTKVGDLNDLRCLTFVEVLNFIYIGIMSNELQTKVAMWWVYLQKQLVETAFAAKDKY